MKRNDLKNELIERINANFENLKETFLIDMIDFAENDDYEEEELNEMIDEIKSINNSNDFLNKFTLFSFNETFDEMNDDDIEFLNKTKNDTILFHTF